MEVEEVVAEEAEVEVVGVEVGVQEDLLAASFNKNLSAGFECIHTHIHA